MAFKLGQKAFNEDAKYSRFHSASRLVPDSQDSEAVQATLATLLDKAAPELEKAASILTSVFTGTHREGMR